jgi:hypothetical protein
MRRFIAPAFRASVPTAQPSEALRVARSLDEVLDEIRTANANAVPR